MTLTPSKMVEIGSAAPEFALPDTKGNLVSLGDFDTYPALLVVFMCNHCPYVKHIRNALAKFADENVSNGLATVGINSNDFASYPADSPEKMIEEIELAGYKFPYLIDADQQVALAYGAACTPDFFLYDNNRKLVYRGQFDDSRPGNAVSVTGADLQRAVDALLAGRAPIEDQKPSVGCNIKWKPANAPN